MNKAVLRKEVLERRKSTHGLGRGSGGNLSAFLAGYRGVPLAGYLPINTEIDPRSAMAEAAAYGPVGVPVVLGPDQPLRFRQWQPGCAVEIGEFGAPIPVKGEWIIPEILIVPLVAFDRNGARLGYGGGFYDRTLEELRDSGPTLAIGFAYEVQEVVAIPQEPTDQPLDLIVTECGVITPKSSERIFS